MKRAIVAIAFGALLMTASPVLAGGGYGHGYRGGYYNDNNDNASYLVGGLLGGLLLGSLLTQNAYERSYRSAPVYAAPPPRARYDCKPTTGIGYAGGRLATYGGTWCYDAAGIGYVVSGSAYFIGYAE